ncbi:SNU71 [Candida oxycetoniae]|uniref:U1 small nuclear ribonucleoprotein component SNU71 n=1 Tax=Candida oxycetoniae TaxID=497107 RepID=A0AAI9SZ03_9ASCO|nr:SNU71 [Candida oxycetoniae]KAI3405766.2 SNU71 [Candida oxycetoniae]
MVTVDRSGLALTFVSPYTIPASNHSKLLSLLFSKEESNDFQRELESTPPFNLNLPIVSQFDASELIELNNTKILSQTAAGQRAQVTNRNEESTADIVVDENQEPKLYIDIESIRPKTLKDQLSTIIFNNFPNLKSIVVEKVLLSLINLNVDFERKFNWSIVNYEFVDSKVIFVKFQKLEDVKWFVETFLDMMQVIPKVEIIYSNKLDELLSEIKVQPGIITDHLKTQIKLILFNSKNYASSKQRGFEDLDQAMRSYSNYKVDKNDLIDVPNDMKEGIIRDIIRFRTKMLTIEKENRQKQIETERHKTKHKLSKLFEKIQEAAAEAQTKTKTKAVDESSSSATATSTSKLVEDDIEILNEHEELNDTEYNAMIKAEETAEDTKEYEQRLAKLKVKEINERAQLYHELELANNYEPQLLENKLDYIDKFKNYYQNGLATLYESNYNEYLKQRNAKRSLEEKNDELDEEKEKKEVAKVTLPSFKKSKVEQQHEREQTKTKVEPSEENKTIVINDLSPELKEQIKSKIDDLVEDCLGVKDDVLLEVIYQNLQTNNLKGKKTLVSDLEEVLDEDAETLINNLYDFINSVA